MSIKGKLAVAFFAVIGVLVGQLIGTQTMKAAWIGFPVRVAGLAVLAGAVFTLVASVSKSEIKDSRSIMVATVVRYSFAVVVAAGLATLIDSRYLPIAIIAALPLTMRKKADDASAEHWSWYMLPVALICALPLTILAGMFGDFSLGWAFATIVLPGAAVAGYCHPSGMDVKTAEYVLLLCASAAAFIIGLGLVLTPPYVGWGEEAFCAGIIAFVGYAFASFISSKLTKKLVPVQPTALMHRVGSSSVLLVLLVSVVLPGTGYAATAACLGYTTAMFVARPIGRMATAMRKRRQEREEAARQTPADPDAAAA